MQRKDSIQPMSRHSPATPSPPPPDPPHSPSLYLDQPHLSPCLASRPYSDLARLVYACLVFSCVLLFCLRFLLCRWFFVFCVRQGGGVAADAPDDGGVDERTLPDKDTATAAAAATAATAATAAATTAASAVTTATPTAATSGASATAATTATAAAEKEARRQSPAKVDGEGDGGSSPCGVEKHSDATNKRPLCVTEAGEGEGGPGGGEGGGDGENEDEETRRIVRNVRKRLYMGYTTPLDPVGGGEGSSGGEGSGGGGGLDRVGEEEGGGEKMEEAVGGGGGGAGGGGGGAGGERRGRTEINNADLAEYLRVSKPECGRRSWALLSGLKSRLALQRRTRDANGVKIA